MKSLNASVSGEEPSPTLGGIDRDAVQLATAIVNLFGECLTGNRFERGFQMDVFRKQREMRELVEKLQTLEVLSNASLPESLRVAISHIDSQKPERTLGFVREAFVRASAFSGATYTPAG